ncbi:MAG: acyltransferase [Acidobacteria bacterium]|nr:acyltransferase [Acidobacteriota bacterium]
MSPATASGEGRAFPPRLWRQSLQLFKAGISSSLAATNLIVIFTGMIPVALLKLTLPFTGVRTFADRILNAMVEGWIAVNGWWIALAQRIRWDVRGVEGLQRKGWYLVGSNHQSWVDIFVLQKVFNRRVPFLKFFIKRELIYLPVLGWAWWAMDFPFVRRRGGSSRQADLRTARKACDRFQLVPTSVISFFEGTRFSQRKHRAQASPYRHLLKPKAGGLAATLAAMGDRFHALLDVTIVYPDGAPSFWDLLCGKVREVVVRVRSLEIPGHLLEGDYEGDPEFRARVQAWVRELWEAKDKTIEEIRLQLDQRGRATA